MTTTPDNIAIHATSVVYPEPKPLYIIEENTPCGWRILATTHSEQEAQALYDRLSGSEVVQ